MPHIETSPLAGMKRLKTDNNGRIRYLDKAEELALRNELDTRQKNQRADRKRFIEWCKDRHRATPAELTASFTDYLKPIVILALNTGMRRGELFDLKWSDLDLNKRLLTIIGETAKSGHTRHIPLNDEAFSTLVAWRIQTGGKKLVFPSPAPKKQKNNDALPDTEQRMNNINSSWKNLIINSGVKNFRFHDLRHNFASQLAMAGVDLNTVRELLGHQDIATTLRYAHLAPEHKAAAVAVLGNLSS